MKIERKGKTILFILFMVVGNILLFCLGIGKCGFKEGFFDTSLMGIIGFDITILISVYLVQNLIDKRRRNEYIVKLLDFIVRDFESPDLFSHDEKIKKNVRQAYIENRLYYLKVAVPDNVKEDMNEVFKMFSEAREYFDEHTDTKCDDIFYQKKRALILGKISKIQLGLYGFNIEERK